MAKDLPSSAQRTIPKPPGLAECPNFRLKNQFGELVDFHADSLQGGAVRSS